MFRYKKCGATFAALVAVLISMPSFADTATEIKKLIADDIRYTEENLAGRPDALSMNGSLEFWSSGGLLQVAEPASERFEVFRGKAKHIEVIVLVEGEAAVAQFYQEAVMQPVGLPLVSDYRTRVTQVFRKEGGTWRIVAAHYSPLRGGSGTPETQ